MYVALFRDSNGTYWYSLMTHNKLGDTHWLVPKPPGDWDC